MGYRESLEYLYGLQRFGVKLGLENIRVLLDRLGHPERAYSCVHVAGSNGKGSVCSALAEVLRRAGHRVGLYTSPHLHSFTERIRVDGVAIDEAEVVQLADELRGCCEGIPATFFEFTTAMALRHFQRHGVEIAVLETGMGGRLDATNAVTPCLSLITPVCCDHAEHLGPDLLTIADEKAGIIKSGVPVLVGRQEPAVTGLFVDRAQQLQAPLCLYDRDFSVVPAADGTFAFHGLGLDLPGLRPGLSGAHQQQNLGLALAAAVLLRRQGVAIAEPALRSGVELVRWPGRLEWCGAGRQVLLDGAHNEGGARVLADYLAVQCPAGVRWVVGLSGQRRLADLLVPLRPHLRALYCTEPPAEGAVPALELQRCAADAGLAAAIHTVPAVAVEAALADCGEGEIVLVAGSLYLVAAVREYLQQKEAGRP